MRQRAGKSAVGDNEPVPAHAMARSARRVLKHVDVYPKLHRDFTVQTKCGATVSLVAGVVLLVLFLAELKTYLSVTPHEHMVVDASLGEKLQVNFDVSFLALNCRDAHLNAMDVAGELQIHLHQTVVSTRLDPMGRSIGRSIAMKSHVENDSDEMPRVGVAESCGNCYGAGHLSRKTCCNTCDDVKEAFVATGRSLEEAEATAQCVRETVEVEKLAQDGEGCRFTGKMFVNRVAGNFHVALGRTFHRQGKMVHQFRPGQEYTYNSSHIIHSLSFGELMPGITGSLDGVKKIATAYGGVFQYHIKIVPTIYSDVDENTIHSYQFSFTQQSSYLNPYYQMTSLPGTFFVFDFSPFMLKVENNRMPFTHFLTKICAIIGGVISIASFVDSFMYNSLHGRRRTTTGDGVNKYG